MCIRDRLAAVRLIAKYADMFPFVSDYTHTCFLHVVLLQLLLTLLLLSRSAHGHAVRLKIPHPLPMARAPTIKLPSRGFGCCTHETTSPPRHYLRDPPPSQARPPSVIHPCPPVMLTYCSRVLSHHIFRRALRRSCHCSGPSLIIETFAFLAPTFELALPLPPLTFPCAFPPLPQ